MDRNERIARIMSGSCTPACDLQALVESGEITREQASNAMQARFGTHSSLAAMADAERVDMRSRDC